MKIKSILLIAIGLLLGSIALFMGFDTGISLDYVLTRRAIRLGTMLVVGISVGYSSLIFQTITNNRILTPSIMGYEAIFILFQTILVFIYGDKTFQVITQEINFFYAVLLMILFSLLMYFVLFGKERRHIFHLLLLGMVLGTVFLTLSQFLQVLLDPNKFSMVQHFMFVSFNKMNLNLLLVAGITLAGTLIFLQPRLKYLDIIALGRAHAINLGLPYQKLLRQYLLAIAVLVSVSTALVGPITFLGILVTNLSYAILPTYRHTWLGWFCALLACIFLIVGQFFVEHIFGFSTTVSIIINFIGGIYFILLILKTQKRL